MSKSVELSFVMRLRGRVANDFAREQRTMQGSMAATDRAAASLAGKTRELDRTTQRAGQNTGRLSQHLRELERDTTRSISATQRLTQRVRELANVRGPVALVNSLQRVYDLARRTAPLMHGMRNVGAGALAGGYVMAQPVKRTMAWDERLAHAANTAYAGDSLATRKAGKGRINDAVNSAVRYGGGTRDDALAAYDSMMAAGTVSASGAQRLLPKIMRTATASGAQANDLAQIVLKSMANAGIKEGEAGDVLDMALVAGQQGGFEIKDMARWLPSQIALASQNGMKGKQGLASLLAANQAVVTTAGSPEQAGNNLVNLLGKINSADTARDLKGKGIDLSGTLAAANAKGVNSLDAFVGIVDSVVAKDKRFQALRAKAAGMKPGESLDVVNAQSNILEQSSVGQVIQDREAMMALVAIMNQRGRINEIKGQSLAGAGRAVDDNYALIAETASHKAQSLANEKAIAEDGAFGGMSEIVGDASSKLAEWAQTFPGMATATIAATTTLTALAGAAGAASLSSMLGGGGKGAGRLAGLAKAGRLSLGLAGTMGVGSLAAAGAAGAATVAGGALAAGAAGYGVGTGIYGMIDETAFANKLGEGIARVLAKFGNDNAQQALQVSVTLDGQDIASTVETRTARGARRQ